MEPSITDELDWSIDWILSLETPPRPWPSGWKDDIAWCNYWREKRHRVLEALERAKRLLDVE